MSLWDPLLLYKTVAVLPVFGVTASTPLLVLGSASSVVSIKFKHEEPDFTRVKCEPQEQLESLLHLLSNCWDASSAGTPQFTKPFIDENSILFRGDPTLCINMVKSLVPAGTHSSGSASFQ